MPTMLVQHHEVSTAYWYLEVIFLQKKYIAGMLDTCNGFSLCARLTYAVELLGLSLHSLGIGKVVFQTVVQSPEAWDCQHRFISHEGSFIRSSYTENSCWW